MKKIISVLILFIICVHLVFSQEIDLTIYNQNLGLVKDRRTLKIDKGVQKIEFTDVAAKIDPTSVHFKSLTNPEKCSVLEQNFEYDLISRDKLLQKYIGKEIELEKRIGKDGDKKEIIKGTLLSTAGGLTIKSDDKILVNPSGDVSLSKIPEGLILKPTLSWLLQNDVSGENKIEVDYLTNGINWDADYVVVSDKDDKNIDLNGWVTIDNKSGATYKEAKLKLIAGDIHRIAPDALAENDVMYEAKAMRATAAPQFQEKSFFEYHMYTLQRKTTVKDNETKQIDFEYDLPASLIDGGKCIARVDAGKYSSAQIPFEILPFEVKGEILFKSADLGKVKLKEQVIAGVEVKNTGEIKKIFSLSAEIKGPWDYTYKFSMQKTDLAVNEAKQVELTRDIEDTCREGIYNIQLALYADVMGVSKKTDEKQFKYEVMDTSPEIKFLNFDLSAQAGEKVYLKIKVSDDREIKDVRITYINPEGRENKTVKMVNVQGTKLEGIYSYESAKFGKSGKFSFYIEATDSKPQTTKTEPYNVTVLKP